MQLVINTFGASLRKEGERFVVRAGDKHRAVSAHKVRSILLTTAVHLSTDAIELAVANNIDLVFLDRHGDPYARVWQTRMGSTAAIRRRQLEVADGPEGLGIVVEWVGAKLRHQAEFLEELRHRRPESDGLFTGPLGPSAPGWTASPPCKGRWTRCAARSWGWRGVPAGPTGPAWAGWCRRRTASRGASGGIDRVAARGRGAHA